MAKQIGPTIPGGPLTFAKELGKYAKQHGLGAIRYATPKLRAEMAKDFGVVWPGIVGGTITGNKLKSTFFRLDRKYGGFLTGVSKTLDPTKGGALAIIPRQASMPRIDTALARVGRGAPAAAAGAIPRAPGVILETARSQAAGAGGRIAAATGAGAATGAAGSNWMTKLLKSPFAKQTMGFGLALAASYTVIRIMDMADVGGLRAKQLQFGGEMMGMQAGLLPGETAEEAGGAQFNSRLLAMLESKYAGQGGVSPSRMMQTGGFGTAGNRASDDIVIGGQQGNQEAELITMLQNLGVA